MNRLLAVVLAGLMLAHPAWADSGVHLTPPKGRAIRVAFTLSEGATMIDFAGPWEVFQDVMLPDRGKSMAEQMPFELYTVAGTHDPIHTSAPPSHAGMTVVPDYTFADAPTPDLVIVGAQAGGPALEDWLRKMHGGGVTVMSVCAGAFILAKTGLLDGKSATTHPAYYDRLADRNPNVKVVRGVRFVRSDDVTYTAGGLFNGIDLALHMVAEYFGDDVAKRVADYMQYRDDGWKNG